jgi:hypothetical protein
MSDGILQSKSTIDFVVDLQRRESNALGFLPRSRYEKHLACDRLVVQTANGQRVGFLAWGLNDGFASIHQVCTTLDARRWRFALMMVIRLVAKLERLRCFNVRLRCAMDLEARYFWQALGFDLVSVVPGGRGRGRLIGLWTLHLDFATLNRLVSLVRSPFSLVLPRAARELEWSNGTVGLLSEPGAGVRRRVLSAIVPRVVKAPGRFS